VSQPRHVLSVAVIEKRAVGMRSIVFRRFEALGKKCQRTADLLVTGDRTISSVLPRIPWTISVVEEAIDQVVCVLVFVTVLKGENLQNDLGEDVCDTQGNLRVTAIVETVSFDDALDVVPGHQLRAAHVERS
jgi:hypothetical protein